MTWHTEEATLARQPLYVFDDQGRCVAYFSVQHPRAVPNARLGAAAPALRDALSALVDFFAGDEAPEPALAAARALLERLDR